MELCRLKKQPIWLWWAIDRTSHQIVGFALGDRGTQTAKVLQPQLPTDKHIHYCTDAHRPYKSIIKAEQHMISKAHTHHIESLNNKLRWYLARLGRKTHAYSKSAVALLHSLLFVWQRKFGTVLKPQTGALISKRLWDCDIQIPV